MIAIYGIYRFFEQHWLSAVLVIGIALAVWYVYHNKEKLLIGK